MSEFTTNERFRWAARRDTKKREDRAYCLLGIFNVFIPPIYGEGDKHMSASSTKSASPRNRLTDTLLGGIRLFSVILPPWNVGKWHWPL